jgi:hypothetical protein
MEITVPKSIEALVRRKVDEATTPLRTRSSRMPCG